jgi:spore coat assembly protein
MEHCQGWFNNIEGRLKKGGEIMPVVKVGEIVVRKSYNGDIIFRVEQIIKVAIGKDVAILKGINLRLLADAPIEDLQIYQGQKLAENTRENDELINAYLSKSVLQRTRGSREYHRLTATKEDYFNVPGRVLHIDGDENYLQKCIDAYAKLNIPAHGYWVPEKDMPVKIVEYVALHQPDIIVITGHDGLLKDVKDFANIDNYRNSRFFMEAVIAVRKLSPNRDGITIFAGACQSHYEALIRAGANFASSPKRVLIHAFDPVFIVEKIAFTSFNESLTITDVIASSITGSEGIGGVETRGKFRLGYPKSPY